MTSYVMDNAWQGERDRLAALEARFDPGTIRHLESIGVQPNWHCWEVGAGGGSIAAWLCAQVGPTGQVLATDLDTRFVGTLRYQNLAVQLHNVVTDPWPTGPFDLIHTRLLLTHLPEREALIHQFVGALAPGGWLVVEEFDLVSAVPDPRIGAERLALVDKGRTAFHAYMASQRGQSGNECGRRLYGWLHDAGLHEIGAEGRVFMSSPAGQAGNPLRHPQVRAAVIATGLITTEELDAYIALQDDPKFIMMTNILMAAWGRRPV